MNRFSLVLFCVILLQLQAIAESVFLDELKIENCIQGWGEAQARKSIEGKTISIGGVVFKNGVGTHAYSVMVIDLKGSAQRFTASVGVDDEVGKGNGSVQFIVKADGKELCKSRVLRGRDPAEKIDVSLAGCGQLTLEVNEGGDGGTSDHADWADAKLTYTGKAPEITGRKFSNGGFESGGGTMPDDWKADGDKSRLRFEWSENGGIGGSRCVAISAVKNDKPSHGSWKQGINLEPYTAYRLKGFMKGKGVKGGDKFPATIGGAWYSRKGPKTTAGDYDWTPIETDFATGNRGRIDIVLELGDNEKGSVGTVYFDDISIVPNPDVERFEGKHFILNLYKDQVALATREGVKIQLANVDELYNAYQELTGFVPDDGAKQSAFAPSGCDIGALGWAGNPVIWHKKAYEETLKKYWIRPEYCPEIFLHELAHNFDHRNWTFHGHFNELKMAYALETRNWAICEDGWTRGPATRNRWEVRSKKNREAGIVNEVVQVYKNLLIRDKIGWEPFKKTFRYFLALKDEDVPKTKWDKFKVWHDKLSEYSGFDAWSVYTKEELEFAKFDCAPKKRPVAVGKVPGDQKETWLAEIKWDSAKVGWEEPKYGFFASAEKLHLRSIYGHAPSEYVYNLDGKWGKLSASCGLAHGREGGSVVFVVKGDGKELFRSGLVRDSKECKISVSLAGVKKLELVVENGGDGGNGDWGIWFDPQMSR